MNHLRITAAAVICAGVARAYAGEAVQNYDIPAQPLQSALQKVADQSGIALFFPESLVAGKSGPALKGQYGAREALEKLLLGSGLTYTFTAADAVSIKSAADQLNKADPQTLPKVNVVGSAADDVKDPYNADYVLPEASSGTKTDTPIMETPLNVQVIAKQVLKDQQVISLDQALKNVSGVVTGGTGDVGTNQTLFLRGFQSETYFRNGFRLQQGAGDREMANVESVEVLKGPAAILYGMVEPGGMVNVVTKQPLAKPYYALNQQVGSYDLYRTTLDASGPVSGDGSLLYRMNMSYQNNGSFRDFVGKEDIFLAPIVKWNISSRTQATFEMEYNHKHAGQNMSFIPWVNGGLLNIPRNLTYGEYSPETLDTVYGGFNWSHQFNDDWQIKHRVSVNQSTDSYDHYVNVPRYAGGATLSRYLLGLQYQNDTYNTNIDLTGHFNTFGLQHTLLLGGDYYRTNTNGNYSGAANTSTISFDNSTIDLLNPQHPGSLFTLPMTPYLHNNTQTDQYGAYIQDQIKLPYDVHVMGGIRYQNFHQLYDSKMDAWMYGGSFTSTAQSQDAVTPRVGLLWQAQPWLSLYANYVESFGPNSGQVFTGLTTPPKSVPATSANQYEGGIKTQFFDGRLRGTLAYYDLTKTNVPISDTRPGVPPGQFVLVSSSVRSRGPELDITGEILPGWNAIATYAYTDTYDASTGGRFYGVPRNTSSFWSTYELQAGELKGLKFGGGVTMRDGRTATTTATPTYVIPGYATVDLMTGYSRNIGKAKVTAQLNINNLLDKNYFTDGSVVVGSGGNLNFGVPRSFMGSIGIQY